LALPPDGFAGIDTLGVVFLLAGSNFCFEAVSLHDVLLTAGLFT
jgi:hypothetical protein